MIDSFAILVFGIAVICVVFKAAKLDKTLPWFQPKPDVEKIIRRMHSAKSE